MAVTGKGINKTKYDGDNTPSNGNVIDAGMRDTSVLCCFDRYLMDTEDIADSTIELSTPPAGAIIVDMVLVSTCAVSGLTFDIGDTDTVDRYINAASGAAASITRLNEGITLSSTIIDTGHGYQIGTTASDDEMILTILGATAVGSVFVWTYYTLGE